MPNYVAILINQYHTTDLFRSSILYELDFW